MVANRVTQEQLQERSQQLQASEISLHNVIIRNADGMVILDKNGIIHFINPAAKALFGREAEELLGAMFGFPVVVGETTEIDIRRKGGEVIVAEMRMVEIEWEGEISYLASLRDITERKQAEEERAQLLYKQAVQTHTQEVQRIKNELLSTLSHELRTPLTPILGWVRLLRKEQFDKADAARAIEVIERNALQQAQIVDDLLDLACLAIGELYLNIQPVDLIPIINAAIDAVRPIAEAKNIRIQISFDLLTNLVAGDPIRLQQVVWNLLSNAIKFTDAGGWVKIELEQVDAAVEITVSDNGRGISELFLPHVFECFTQAESSIIRTHGGLGIGLAIAHFLVEMHSGTIRAFSLGEGQGATFKISLPLLPALSK